MILFLEKMKSAKSFLLDNLGFSKSFPTNFHLKINNDSLLSAHSIADKSVELNCVQFPTVDSSEKSTKFFYQCRALFYQRITIQKRRFLTNLCQIFLPLFLLILIGTLQLLTDSILNQTNQTLPNNNLILLPIDLNCIIPCQLDSSLNRPTNCTNDFRIIRNIVDNPITCKLLKDFLISQNLLILNGNFIDCSNPKRFYNILPQYTLFELPFFYLTSEDIGERFGKLTLNGSKNGFLGSFVDYQIRFSLDFTINPNFNDPFFNDHVIYSNISSTNIFLPFILDLHSSDPDVSLYRIYKDMLNYKFHTSDTHSTFDEYFQRFRSSPSSQFQYISILESVKKHDFQLIRPFASLHINFLNSTMLDIIIISPIFQLSLINFETHRGNQLLNLVSNSFFNSISNISSLNPINTWIFPLPDNENKIHINIFDLTGNLLFPLLTSFILPVYIDILLIDKEGKHLIMMKQSTLHEHTYYFISFLYFLFIYFLTLIPIFVSSIAFQIRLYMHSSLVLLVVIYAIWGCAQIILAFFFSTFFHHSMTATNFAYILVTLNVVISFMVNLLSISESDIPNYIYMLYPPFAYYRIIYLMNLHCQRYKCLQYVVFFSYNVITKSIFFLIVGSILFLFLTFYLYVVIPGEFGYRKHPLFFIKYICRLLYNNAKKINVLMTKKNGKNDNEDIFLQPNPDNANLFSLKCFPICMYHLRKVFKICQVNHVAVDNVSLQIPKNECFGLLGTNGAGKTTLISMLTGIVPPSSGTVIINGLVFQKDFFQIYKNMGYCHQFDILYPDLTCAEHILFYSRLKGVKIKFEKKVLKNVLRTCKLSDVSNVRAICLSGGLRRRLSLALSIINNPTVLILDEPTTGLDPIYRYYIWDLIQLLKKNRSIILTTHNLEEADVLCTKVGILHFGILRALGTQIRLKHIYTNGYIIKIYSNRDKQFEIKGYLLNNLPGAKFIYFCGDFLFYRVPREEFGEILMLTVFGHLSELSLIHDWEIRNSSLEEVLMNVIHYIVDKRSI